MKKTVKSNPLKTFNDNKALAVKKMGSAQASFKKKLPKAQAGQSVGPTPNWTKPYPGYKSPERITKDKTIYQGPLNESESKAVSKGMMSPTMQNYMRSPNQSKNSEEANKKKTGGATKATKFAALAPPFNKATAADRIVGAKKSKKK